MRILELFCDRCKKQRTFEDVPASSVTPENPCPHCGGITTYASLRSYEHPGVAFYNGYTDD